jgi:hypothetical protein
MPEARPWIVMGCLGALVAAMVLLGFFGTQIAERRNYETFVSSLLVGESRHVVAKLVHDNAGLSEGTLPADVPSRLARDPHTMFVWFRLGNVGFNETRRLVIITFDEHDAVLRWRVDG